MVTKQELVNGYETEIKYQRHMLENLGRPKFPSYRLDFW